MQRQKMDRRDGITEQEQATSVLNPAALENLREIAGGDTVFLVELIDAFLDDAPRILAGMRQALEDGDAALLRQSAHSLKSNSAEFGAMALSKLCQEMEMIARAGVLAGALEKLTRIEAEYAKAQAALETAKRQL